MPSNLQYLIAEMSIQAVGIFSQFVNKVSKSLDYKEILANYENHYNLRKFKITEILAEYAFSIFQHIAQKFYKNHSPGQSGTWVENELRLFLWTVICYLEIHGKNLQTLQKQDWDFFASIFYVKQYTLFQYQARILLDQSIKVSKWSEEQDYMLYCIIVKDRSAKWNQIAKSLFLNSNKLYLRASKQCRQRWLNHLDPSKSKSEWSLREYLIMFEQVYEKGKKWAVLVKILKDRRSEHSIKNKYNSIIKKQLRLTPQLTQTQICRQMVDKINRILDTHQIQSNDEYLFGCSLKNLNMENKPKGNQFSDRRNGKNSSEQMQNYHNRFESFRKKIQKFQCFTKDSQPQPKIEPKPRKPAYTKQLNITFPTPKVKRQVDVPLESPKHQDQIFYEQSYEMDGVLRPQEFNVIFADDFKNIINEHDLDL